jgi:ribonuclease VapC
VVDTSALVAVLRRESAARAVVAHLAANPPVVVGAPTLVECSLVIDGRTGSGATAALTRLLYELEAEVAAFSREHALCAQTAFRRYGKGRHPAALNFGDCLTYAVARLAQQPLVCLGEDFRQTDLVTIRP